MKEQKHTLLIVDDEADHRFLAQNTFESLGTNFKVQLAINGDEAIAYLKGEGRFADRKEFEFPSYILTDLNMAPGDGFHLLEFIKNNPDLSVVPVVMVSDSAHPDDIRQAYLLGASSSSLNRPPCQLSRPCCEPFTTTGRSAKSQRSIRKATPSPPATSAASALDTRSQSSQCRHLARLPLLEPLHLPLHHCPRLSRDQIPQRVRGIVSADAIFARVHFQNILRAIRVMLQRRQALHQPAAPRTNEQAWRHARFDVAEAMQALSPADRDGGAGDSRPPPGARKGWNLTI